MYVELHCHSSYSLREGASTPHDMIEQAGALGYQTLALTDHDNLYGAMEFAKKAAANNIRPITGAEVSLTGGYHLTLLVETAAGYANLCRIITDAYMSHSKDEPEVTFATLAEHTEGLIALSGCKQGEIPSLLQSGRLKQAEDAAYRYLSWFGSTNFFIELQQNLTLGDTPRNIALIKLAERLGLAYVATNNVHYHVRERHRLHDVLVAIRHRTTLDASHELRRENSEFYLKSPWEMTKLFATHPRAIKNTLVIAERCTFNLARDLDYRFPHYPTPEGETPDSYLEKICHEALQRKYGGAPSPFPSPMGRGEGLSQTGKAIGLDQGAGIKPAATRSETQPWENIASSREGEFPNEPGGGDDGILRLQAQNDRGWAENDIFRGSNGECPPEEFHTEEPKDPVELGSLDSRLRGNDGVRSTLTQPYHSETAAEGSRPQNGRKTTQPCHPEAAAEGSRPQNGLKTTQPCHPEAAAEGSRTQKTIEHSQGAGIKPAATDAPDGNDDQNKACGHTITSTEPLGSGECLIRRQEREPSINQPQLGTIAATALPGENRIPVATPFTGAPDETASANYLKAEERLQEEMRLIRKHGLAGFFLTYRDILKIAGEVAAQLRGRDPNLPPDERPVGRGRGSSVGSIVCYLIGLSHIDPIKTDLFLGRFLNEDLVSVPDIDLDFPRDIREKLLERVYRDFNEERAALVCSFATYRVRSAIRDIGKTLGLPATELDKLAKLSDRWGSEGITKEMSRIPEFRDRVDSPLWQDLVSLTQQILRLPRHIGQHVGGIILSTRPLKELVPLEPARMAGRVICQWDKDSIDDARFVKIDFLALGMLSLVDECLEIIEKRHGQRPDLGRIPHDDPRVYDKICEGDTIGVFQIESRAQIQSLPSTRPRTIDDLTAQVAIIRPGPILAGAFHPYMEYRQRLHNGEDIDVKYLHPNLKSVLADTLGVILYQDQVLQVAMAIAGYTAGEADRLRRDMSKRNPDEIIQTHWPRFLEGATKLGVSEEIARTAFDNLRGFSGYGFPKSHAAAFALLAYESTWLRTYFPAEYYCALFNNQPMGFYSTEVLVGDARRHRITITRPDVNLSMAKCNVETDRTVRLGLSFVDHLSEETAKEIAQERDQEGEFRSLFDFVRRTRLGRAGIESLIAAGAFADFGLEQRELLWQLGLFCRQEGQQGALAVPIEQDMITPPPMSSFEKMVAEHRALNLSTSQHPMSILRPQLGNRITYAARLQDLVDGSEIQIAGMVVCRQRPQTAKGVVFLLLEDETGLANVVVYPGLLERQRALIRLEPFVIISGRLQRQERTINVIAHNLRRLPRPKDFVSPDSHDFH